MLLGFEEAWVLMMASSSEVASSCPSMWSRPLKNQCRLCSLQGEVPWGQEGRVETGVISQALLCLLTSMNSSITANSCLDHRSKKIPQRHILPTVCGWSRSKAKIKPRCECRLLGGWGARELQKTRGGGGSPGPRESHGEPLWSSLPTSTGSDIRRCPFLLTY